MEVKINREIREYSESVYFGLSLRQFIFSMERFGVLIGRWTVKEKPFRWKSEIFLNSFGEISKGNHSSKKMSKKSAFSLMVKFNSSSRVNSLYFDD